MKKGIGIILAAVLALALAGCGDDEKVIGGDVSNAPGSSRQTTGGNGETAGGAQAAGKGYVFRHNGVAVSVDGDMAPVLEGLGEPASYFEAASCAFEGLDKTYTYGSFEIMTYPQGDQDLVSKIILKDDTVSTAEKITIGSSREAVTEAYGTDYSEQGSMLVYQKDGMRLCILVEDDAVTSIQYQSTVLEE